MTETQILDLTSALWTQNNTQAASDTTSDVIIDWGDSRQADRTNCKDKSTLIHTYKEPNIYQVKLYGTIKWFTSAEEPSLINRTEHPNDLAAHLIEINVPNICPIRQFAGMETIINASGYAFSMCLKLKTVIGNLTNGLVESETNRNSYGRMFWHTLITEMPTITQLSNMSFVDFDGMFNSTKITQIKKDFFTGINPNADIFGLRDTFYMCPITSIPEGLLKEFPQNVRAADINNCFKGCHQLTGIPADFFNYIPNSSGVQLYKTFNDCPAITGEIQPVWETHTEITQHTNTFYGCVNASNYQDIPLEWGGPGAVDTTNYSSDLEKFLY